MTKPSDEILNQTLNYNEQPSTPETFLFISVILQALLDAITEENPNSDTRKDLNRKRALSWFYASIGVTASDFEDVCDLANIDSNQMRTFAIDVITSDNKKEMREKINLLFSHRMRL